MLKEDNYSAWSVSTDSLNEGASFNEWARRFASYVVLAPSSHNSQPWRVRIEEPWIHILPEEARSLPESDSDNRQLFISLGAGMRNAVLSADYFGFSAEIKLDREGAHIKFTRKEQPSIKAMHPIFSMTRRATNRSAYLSAFGDEHLLTYIKSFETPDVRVDIVGNSEKKNQIAECVSRALIYAMDSAGFRNELSGYLKNNLTRSDVGMVMSGFGVPTPPSFFAGTVLKYFNLNRLSARKDEDLLKHHTPYFVLVSTHKDTPVEWMHVGSVYQEIALRAEARNSATAIMAAAIQVGEFHKELQRVLETEFRPQLFFRLGYPTAPASHSPRIPVTKILFT